MRLRPTRPVHRTTGSSEDALALRRLRVRLMGWSAGSTLVVLVVLGALLYWSVANALRSASIEQLQGRATAIAGGAYVKTSGSSDPAKLQVTVDNGDLGLAVGGPASGTIALIVSGMPGPADAPLVVAGTTTEAGTTKVVIPAPDPADIIAAQGGATIIRESSSGALPVRVLLAPVPAIDSTAVVEVIGDRTKEEETLRTMVGVLLVGGAAVLGVAVALGYLYAGRALVPIRESLRRQREFAADASHELRTPLTIVRSATQQLRRHGDDPAAAARLLDDVDAGTDRLTRLVDDLLLLARSDADTLGLTTTHVDLGDVAADTAASFSALAAERGARIRLDVEPSPVAGDPERLRQVAGILLDNAIRHSPSGGLVTIRTREPGLLEVQDQGPGIPAEDREHVFQRFWRRPGSPPDGHGLGLAIARSIADHHGGAVEVIDGPGPGACLRLSLPPAPSP